MGSPEDKFAHCIKSTLVPPPTQPGSLKMKLLSPTELAEVCLKIGAPPSLYDHESTSSKASLRHPISSSVPPGLYRTVLHARRHSQSVYYFTSLLYTTCILLQLLFGASLTALGSSSTNNSHRLSITILAAANTVNAGLIALLHNSGLPNRIKQDWNEWAKVEMCLQEMVMTGLVGENEGAVESVKRCWDLYLSLIEAASFCLFLRREVGRWVGMSW